jgi:AraC-like DNA-binding protein
LRLYDLTYGTADVTVDPVPFDEFVLVTQPVSGRFVVRSGTEGEVGSERDALVMDAYDSYRLRRRNGSRVLHLVIDRVPFERIAAEMRGFHEPVSVHFQLGRPTTPAAGRAWSRLTRFVGERIGPTAGDQLGPLASAELLRFTAAALLDANPSTCRAAEFCAPGTVAAAAVRRAVAYIEQRAGDPIGVHDIAAAARLSTRGLQAAFQRYQQTTPMNYLRQTRMQRAHADLRAASPQDTTVAAVASRWGFVNLGRFSADYRRLYGEFPREVLAGTHRMTGHPVKPALPRAQRCPSAR